MHMKSCNLSWLRFYMLLILNHSIKYTRQMPSLIQVFWPGSWRGPWSRRIGRPARTCGRGPNSQLSKSVIQWLFPGKYLFSLIHTCLENKLQWLNPLKLDGYFYIFSYRVYKTVDFLLFTFMSWEKKSLLARFAHTW